MSTPKSKLKYLSQVPLHPLADFALAAFQEDECWDAPKLGFRMAGNNLERSSQAHTRVAKDVLESLEAHGRLARDPSGWWRISS